MAHVSYGDAREFFEAAREAALDANRISRQLLRMEEAATSPGGQSFEPRVRSTPDPTRMAAATAALVDVGERLRARQDEDYRLIDAACHVLYGTDDEAGLWSLVGWRADAIFHHYLALRTWAEVGEMLGYGEQHVWRQAMAALDSADAWGVVATVAGRGFAEDAPEEVDRGMAS